jgi:hypothetical protein
MPRETTVGEFVAEELEREADAMPAGYKTQADSLRDAAKIYREFASKRKVRVSEESEGAEATVSRYNETARQRVKRAERERR